ncbi:hypothetical protein H5P28_11635 [Ruficoccus amylovorans]|uniref:Uncharacterized protein n=1 Tax=Ruficoccus amylovorans TaxID=1804625 RepID=A0A842HF68_9BACT|nr:hypothetical protein [Ruficoccus amylovorans]MBC2594909.1 hypothetical protein [Ruficoccus amylovorans]
MEHAPSIALDLGTYMGYAIRTAGGSVVSGVEVFASRPGEDTDVRFWAFRKWLIKAITQYEPKRIYYEHASFQPGNASEVWFGWLTIIKEVRIHYGLGRQGFNAATIKLHASGHGHAGKDRMKAAVRDLFPQLGPIDNDNQADALAVLYTGECWKAGKLNRAPKPTRKRKPGKRRPNPQSELF